jgi:hypothetical protein
MHLDLEIFPNNSRLFLKDFRKNIICHAMQCILYKIYFWKFFSYVLQIDMHFICTPMWTKFYSCKKWVLPSLSFNTFSSSFSLSLFLYAPSLEDLAVLMLLEKKNHFFKKLLFKWNGMDWLSVNIGGGRIFRNGVMHTNMAEPWSWRWESCGYIGGGRIFQSGGMHADIFSSQIIFKKSSKLKWTHPLTKLNTNKSCYVDNIWLW